jgi:hypothetical protein
MLVLRRGGGVFSLSVHVSLKRLLAGVREFFEVRPVLGADDPRERRVAKLFGQADPFVQSTDVVHAGHFTTHRQGGTSSAPVYNV